MFRDIATIVADKCVNPTSNRPYPVHACLATHSIAWIANAGLLLWLDASSTA